MTERLMRPDLRHVPDNVWPDAPETRDVVVPLDLSPGGRYVTPECQLGAHWGCPGGLFHEGGRLELPCRCQAKGCECPTRR